jgi:1-aminocyclopropane-1-carboxylate deaminase/D-cysteine desulfhydrase-like pyridoxal-dependent ACC family enzyme
LFRRGACGKNISVTFTPPRLALGSYPTAVEQIEPFLWVKRDDGTSEVYGGNKVRKLELFLGAAREQNKTRLLTIGAAGSHQVVATTIFGARHGFEVEAVLVPQPGSDHARLNLRVALAHGLRAIAAPAWAIAPAILLARRGSDAYPIPLGGSNALGSLGFVEAGRELAAQVRAGQMPEPDAVVVALGSGGTAAGLAVALEEAQMKTRVVAASVVHPKVVLSLGAHRLVKQTAALAGLPREIGARASKRLEVTGDWVGRGYAIPTEEGEAATAVARTHGLELDLTYTAKAFACALAMRPSAEAEKKTILYWHTLSHVPLAGLAGDELPPRLAKLFR